MDNILIISNAILWLCVIGLCFLVFALARQIGVLYERVAPAGALMINKTLEVGGLAPKLDLENINTGKIFTVGEASLENRSQLLFFVSPSCPVCKTLLPMLLSAKKSESAWLDIVLASDGELADHQKFIARYELESIPYVSSEKLGMQYGVAKLPYAVLIGDDGKIASMGLINSREHLESLFESKERGVASIQEYLKKQSEQQFSLANEAP